MTPAKPVTVEVVSCEPNIVVRPAPSVDVVNWAADQWRRHPTDMSVMLPMTTVQTILRLLGDKARRLP